MKQLWYQSVIFALAAVSITGICAITMTLINRTSWHDELPDPYNRWAPLNIEFDQGPLISMAPQEIIELVNKNGQAWLIRDVGEIVQLPPESTRFRQQIANTTKRPCAWNDIVNQQTYTFAGNIGSFVKRCKDCPIEFIDQECAQVGTE